MKTSKPKYQPKINYSIPLTMPYEKRLTKVIPAGAGSRQIENGTWQEIPDYITVVFRNYKQTALRLNPAIKKIRKKLQKAKIKYNSRLHYQDGRNYLIITNERIAA